MLAIVPFVLVSNGENPFESVPVFLQFAAVHEGNTRKTCFDMIILELQDFADAPGPGAPLPCV